MIVREYDESMKRITVSLPDELVEQALAAVAAGRAKSVSAYVARSMEQAAPKETLDDLLAEWIAEAPPWTPEEDQRVEDALEAMHRAARR